MGRQVNSCSGYPYKFDENDLPDELGRTAPKYTQKSLMVCGRSMYAAVCYSWTDKNQVFGIQNSAQMQKSLGVDTSPLGMLKNYQWAGGIPSTVSASVGLIVAIPAILNGVMAMNSSEGGVKATGGLAVGFTICGFCGAFICACVVWGFAAGTRVAQYWFAIFDIESEGDECAPTSACYKSIQEQASLAGTISYYFATLSFMNGFLLLFCLLQAIFALVVCCAYKKKNEA